MRGRHRDRRPLTSPERVARWTRRWLGNPVGALLAGALVAAVAVPSAAAVGAWIDRRSDAAASELVDAYVEALLAGDAEGATAMAPPDGGIASTTFLDDDVVATAVRPSLSCADPIVDDDVAHAVCAIDDAPQSGWSLTLGLRADGWRITDGLAALVHVAPGVVTGIAGHRLPQAVADEPVAIWLYPGTYVLDVADSPMLDRAVATLEVSGDMDVTGLGDIVALGADAIDVEHEAAIAFVTDCIDGGGDCPRVAPVTDATSFVAVGSLPTTLDDRTIETPCTVQRLEDGEPIAAYAVIVTSTLTSDLQSIDVQVRLAADVEAP